MAQLDAAVSVHADAIVGIHHDFLEFGCRRALSKDHPDTALKADDG
jgi:hypothetical protein